MRTVGLALQAYNAAVMTDEAQVETCVTVVSVSEVHDLADRLSRVERVLVQRGVQVHLVRTLQDVEAECEGSILCLAEQADEAAFAAVQAWRDREASRDQVLVVVWTDMAVADTAGSDFMVAGADYALPLPAYLTLITGLLSVTKRRVDERRATRDQISGFKTALAEVRGAYASLDEDLGQAQQLQQSLVKDRYVSQGRAEVAMMLQASGHVGGDLVGQFQVNRDHLCFFALDVSGHGVTSALMAARLAGNLSMAAPHTNIAVQKGSNGYHPRPPAEVAADLNMLVLEDLETEHYFTMVFGHLNTQTGRIQAVQAGHPYPILIHTNGQQQTLGEGGLPVGLIPNAQYQEFDLTLAPGQRFLTLSDGFSEAPLPGNGQIGETGLARILKTVQDAPLTQILDMLVWRLNQTCGDGAFADDLSGIVIEMR